MCEQYWCVNPRHSSPCPTKNCSACDDECGTDFRYFGSEEEVEYRLIENENMVQFSRD